MKKNFFRLVAYVLLCFPFYFFLTGASNIGGGGGCSNVVSQFTVSSSGENVSIDPSTAQVVDNGSTQSFTITANEGFTLTNTVGGTCPAGSWADNVYTTGAITADCSVSFSATNDPVTVTPSGENVTISPDSVQTIAYNETQSFSVTADSGYTLSSTVEGTCPEGSWADNVYTTGEITSDCTVVFSATQNAPDTTTLTSSVSELALSVTGFTEYGVSGTPSSGVARTITLTNTGSNSVANLAITYPTWPSGTTADSNCGSTLASNGTCTITITPGNTASSDGSSACNAGTEPLANTISVSGDNITAVTIDAFILSYGCIYQGGYIFAFDDTTASSASVGGKVLNTSDLSDGIIWSSDTFGDYDNGVAIYGISELSTTLSPDPSSGEVTGQTACDGNLDGVCNTNNINIYYQNDAVDAPVDTSFYAAGLCTQTISGYSDWYLPAICEMGYDTIARGTGCGSGGAPTLQNIQSNLVDLNGISLSSFYWSSTEASLDNQDLAFIQFIDGSGGLQQSSTKSASNVPVRCTRSF